MKSDCLIKTVRSIDKSVWDNWWSQKKGSTSDERKRIVDMAAKIILEDITSKEYDTNNYELLDAECEADWFKHVPSSLKSFLDIIIKSGKKKNEKNDSKWNKRVATMAHCLISSVRPRSFLSSILQGFSSFMHKTFGARDLIDALSYAGLCTTYKETLSFEASILEDPENHKMTGPAYVQYIYDNADHNTRTIDGNNAFHSMGGAKVITPKSSVIVKKIIPRLRKIPSAEHLAKRGFIKLEKWNKPKGSEGLKGVEIEEISEGCGSFQCGCRKQGLQCTSLCTNCDCESCSNFEEFIPEDESTTEDTDNNEEGTDFGTNFLDMNLEVSEEPLSCFNSDDEDYESDSQHEIVKEPPAKRPKNI